MLSQSFTEGVASVLWFILIVEISRTGLSTTVLYLGISDVTHSYLRMIDQSCVSMLYVRFSTCQIMHLYMCMTDQSCLYAIFEVFNLSIHARYEIYQSCPIMLGVGWSISISFYAVL